MELDLIFKIVGIGMIIGIVNSVLDKSGAAEYKMYVSIAGLITALILLVPYIEELFATIRNIFGLY